MFILAGKGFLPVGVIAALLILAGCDFTDEQACRRRKFDDVGEIDVHGREQQYSYGGRQVQDRRPQCDAVAAGRRHAHEVGELCIDDQAAPSGQIQPAKRAQLERMHPLVSVTPPDAPAPRAAPEYRTGKS